MTDDNKNSLPDPDEEEYYDSLLVSLSTISFENKLEEQRKKGKDGWWDEKKCSIDYLESLLQDSLNKKKYLNVAIYAMMIYVRNNRNKGYSSS